MLNERAVRLEDVLAFQQQPGKHLVIVLHLSGKETIGKSRTRRQLGFVA